MIGRERGGTLFVRLDEAITVYPRLAQRACLASRLSPVRGRKTMGNYESLLAELMSAATVFVYRRESPPLERVQCHRYRTPSGPGLVNFGLITRCSRTRSQTEFPDGSALGINVRRSAFCPTFAQVRWTQLILGDLAWSVTREYASANLETQNS